jgi:CRP-like cAMP-binding protein
MRLKDMTLTTQEFCKRFPKITEHTNNHEVSALIRSLKFASIGEKKHIIKDNQKNDALYFVMEGTLDCYIEQDGRKITIGKIYPGEYIGEVSMLDGDTATSSVITETPCIIYSLTRDAFNELEKEYPTISGKILRSISSILSERLKSADRLLFDGLINAKQEHPDNTQNYSTREWFVKIYHHLHYH